MVSGTQVQVQARVVRYADRAAWLKGRETTIGASDVPTILGVNPYKSAFTLWAEKTEKLAASEAGLAARVGLALEGLLTNLYEEEVGRRPVDPGHYTVYSHPDFPFWTCTPDRLWMDGDVILRAVELKTIGEQAARQLKNGEPPLPYQVQLQAQLAVLGIEEGDLACLTGNRAFDVFSFRRHERLIKTIEREVRAFQERVEAKEAPPVDDSKSTAATLAALHPNDSGATKVLTDEEGRWVHELRKCKATIKGLKAKKRGLENRLKATLGNATFGAGEDVEVSYKTETRAGCLRVALEDKKTAETFLTAAGIAFKETANSEFRVLRIK